MDVATLLLARNLSEAAHSIHKSESSLPRLVGVPYVSGRHPVGVESLQRIVVMLVKALPVDLLHLLIVKRPNAKPSVLSTGCLQNGAVRI